MAPMKNKNKIINDEAETSAAASKRRRIEPRNTTFIGGTTNLTLSPPAAIPQIPVEQPAGDDYDDVFSSLITQQNFIIDYHMNQMQLNVEEFLRTNFADELNKKKEIEAMMIQKEEQLGRFREMYHFYEKRACLLEEMLQQKVAGGGGESSATAAIAPVEEVESSNFVDLNSVSKMEMVCKNCRSRPATMLWLPCRHLCVCLLCERRVRTCPICGDRKTESFMVITG